MSIPTHLLETKFFLGEGYKPLIDFGAWRVAILRHIAELEPQNITNIQRHDETDEIFVLLAGHCILFLGEGFDTITQIKAVDMQPLILYNVKKSAWHTHTLSKDATVLIVENLDTTVENSPLIDLDKSQREKIIALTHSLWS